MCMKETSLMLTMLIPGPKSPAKDIDVYLQPLIKELQELWKGVWTKDAVRTNKTNVHGKGKARIEGRKCFCKFIKGVRLPDWFGSNFKQKVTADDNNITGIKSHDCHIMMHRLLPYGVQQYLPKSIAAPIIEFCLFFKQLCARTLMQQDMSKAKIQSISILIELEQIFPPAFFDIMIHVAIHLPDEAILGGPIRYRWMFPFERYMKKLKNYVRNKAKPEGSIAEGYVVEEALTFCSRYLKDDVETRFNRLGRNDDGLPEEEPNKFQVFRSACKLTGRMKATRLTTDVRQAVVWFVLNNSVGSLFLNETLIYCQLCGKCLFSNMNGFDEPLPSSHSLLG
ncbi:hypothetical protein Tco_0669839 [Tanacetum coccineum]